MPISETVDNPVIAPTADDGAAGVTIGRELESCACASTGWAASDASTQELSQDPARVATLILRGETSLGGRREFVTMRQEDRADGWESYQVRSSHPLYLF